MTKQELDTSAEAFRGRLVQLAERFGGRMKLAAAAGIGYRTFYSYLTASEPSRPAITRLLGATGADASWLLFGLDPDAKPEQGEDSARSKAIAGRLAAQLRGYVDQLAELSARAGLAPSRLKDLASESGAPPTLDEIASLHELIGVNLDWLVQGTSHPDIERRNVRRMRRFRFDIFMNWYHLRGAEYWMKSLADDIPLPFPLTDFSVPEEVLRSYVPGGIDRIVVDTVETADMEPDVRHGSWLYVDLAQDEPGEGLFLIKWNSTKLLRQLSFSGQVEVTLACRRQDRAKIVTTVEELRENSAVIGRVVAVVSPNF